MEEKSKDSQLSALIMLINMTLTSHIENISDI